MAIAIRNNIQKRMIENFSKEFQEKDLVEIEKIIFNQYSAREKEYKKSIYETMGILDYILKNHSTEKEEYMEKLIKSILQKEIGWNSMVYQKIKIKNRDEILSCLHQESKLQKCEYKCRNPKCKSDQCYIFSLQTRSGDEGMSSFQICMRCNTRSKFA